MQKRYPAGEFLSPNYWVAAPHDSIAYYTAKHGGEHSQSEIDDIIEADLNVYLAHNIPKGELWGEIGVDPIPYVEWPRFYPTPLPGLIDFGQAYGPSGAVALVITSNPAFPPVSLNVTEGHARNFVIPEAEPIPLAAPVPVRFIPPLWFPWEEEFPWNSPQRWQFPWGPGAPRPGGQPVTRPTFVPAPTREPVPPWVNQPWRGYRLAPAPRIRLGRTVSLDVGPRGNPRVREAPDPHLQRPPGRNTRERKALVVSPWLARAMRIAWAYTEAQDILDAVWEALPRNLRTRNPRPQDKLRDLWEHLDALDLEQMAENIIMNEIEDRLIGRFSGEAGRAFRGNPWGPDVGGSLPRVDFAP